MGDWVLPTGHEDAAYWYLEERAYDDDPLYPGTAGTYSYGSCLPYAWTQPIVLLYEGGVLSDKIRFLAEGSYSGLDYAKLELYYSDDWHTYNEPSDGVFSFSYLIWTEVPFDEVEITKARISFFHNGSYYAMTARLYELHFFDTALPEPVIFTPEMDPLARSAGISISAYTPGAITEVEVSLSRQAAISTLGTFAEESPAPLVRRPPVPRIRLDSNQYYYERGTYRYHELKGVTDQITAGEKLVREEGGLGPKIWEMNLILTSVSEFHSLSGSFIKTTPVPESPTSNELTFVDNQRRSHYVYFTEMGPVEAIDRVANILRVPIVLTRSY